MSAPLVDHPAARICPIEHDPERNRLQKAVLDAALNYFIVDQRCCAFFGGDNLSGKYADPHAKGRELEALAESTRDEFLDACAELLKLTTRRKRVRPA